VKQFRGGKQRKEQMKCQFWALLLKVLLVFGIASPQVLLAVSPPSPQPVYVVDSSRWLQELKAHKIEQVEWPTTLQKWHLHLIEAIAKEAMAINTPSNERLQDLYKSAVGICWELLPHIEKCLSGFQRTLGNEIKQTLEFLGSVRSQVVKNLREISNRYFNDVLVRRLAIFDAVLVATYDYYQKDLALRNEWATARLVLFSGMLTGALGGYVVANLPGLAVGALVVPAGGITTLRFSIVSMKERSEQLAAFLIKKSYNTKVIPEIRPSL